MDNNFAFWFRTLEPSLAQTCASFLHKSRSERLVCSKLRFTFVGKGKQTEAPVLEERNLTNETGRRLSSATFWLGPPDRSASTVRCESDGDSEGPLRTPKNLKQRFR
eukprot:8569704-Heterocapsa_arctica.AAC.1